MHTPGIPLATASLCIAISVFGLATTGCGKTAGANTTTPGLADADWIELHSQHLTLYTDMGEKRARKLLANFEQRYSVVAQAVFQSSDYPHFTTQAVVFSREKDYTDRHPHNTAHLTSIPDASGNPVSTLVTAGSPDRLAFELWQHELAHMFLGQSLGTMPKWLSEGMAHYYSTAELYEGRIRLGENLVQIGFLMGSQWQRHTDPSEINVLAPTTQAIKPSQLHTSQFRGYHIARQKLDLRYDYRSENVLYQLSAWTFVHMMMSNVAPYSDALYAALDAAAKGGDFGVELESRIASLGWDAVDEAFYAYIARLETQLWMRDFLGPPPASDIRAAAVSNDRMTLVMSES